jgi:hypothetical protein
MMCKLFMYGIDKGLKFNLLKVYINFRMLVLKQKQKPILSTIFI